jgi:hypothetical protein
MDLRTAHLSGVKYPGSGDESPIEEMASSGFNSLGGANQVAISHHKTK